MYGRPKATLKESGCLGESNGHQSLHVDDAAAEQLAVARRAAPLRRYQIARYCALRVHRRRAGHDGRRAQPQGRDRMGCHVTVTGVAAHTDTPVEHEMVQLVSGWPKPAH